MAVRLSYCVGLGCCIQFFVFRFCLWGFTLTDPPPKKSASTGYFDLESMDMKDIIFRHSKSSYMRHPFAPLKVNHQAHNPDQFPPGNSSLDESSIEKTVQTLAYLGVARSMIDGEALRNLPPWSQIVSNYGSEPVIYGLERCQAYRETVSERNRIIGPAGLFSTGTNVVHKLLINNCVPPEGVRGRRLFQWQVPWGKHSPAEARMQYFARDREYINQTAVLPVVTVRHPITWMYALCQHSYSLQWKHIPEICDVALNLTNPVTASFGYKTVSYDSLLHVWRDWYLQYFQERRFPLVMVRLEDVIFRPMPLVEEICSCIGGRFDPIAEFQILHDSANFGDGHGNHRSTGIVSTFIKYGKPLETFNKMFATNDWETMKDVLKDDHGLSEAFNYRLPK
eukprot:scaffold584_cov132-Cylindrotheca_fusiformis.AAC.12